MQWEKPGCASKWTLYPKKSQGDCGRSRRHRNPCVSLFASRVLAGARVNLWPWADRPYPGRALQECLLSFLGGRSSRSSGECGRAEGRLCQAVSSMNKLSVVQGHHSSSVLFSQS